MVNESLPPQKTKNRRIVQMKKLTTAVTRKGVEKRIEVLLEDEIANFLEENADEASRHKFVVEEYKAQLIERRETRRHRSLEQL